MVQVGHGFVVPFMGPFWARSIRKFNAVSKSAMTLSGGTFAWMLWIGTQTNPPPGASATVLDVPAADVNVHRAVPGLLRAMVVA
jgi:hypothetical protein